MPTLCARKTVLNAKMCIMMRNVQHTVAISIDQHIYDSIYNASNCCVSLAQNRNLLK